MRVQPVGQGVSFSDKLASKLITENRGSGKIFVRNGQKLNRQFRNVEREGR